MEQPENRWIARLLRIALTGLSLTTFVVAAAFAQQPAPSACSPAGTTSLQVGEAVAAGARPFGGVIKRDARESKPCWDPRIVPPKGAPNVLLIMTDDAGFGVSSTFGGVIPTPALDRIANNGLRYTNFNSTALCSPTRAASDHWAQPSLGGLRRDLRTGHRLSRL